jgi:hypothetical protein
VKLRAWVRNRIFTPYKAVIASGEIRSYLRRTSEPKLNIGAGGNRLPGWCNTDFLTPPDVVWMDASKRWPFEDDVLYAVHCEHMIEHVSKEVGCHLLQEAFRTMRCGAQIRIVTPDLTTFASILADTLKADSAAEGYLEFLYHFYKRREVTWCDAMNFLFYDHGHRYLYTSTELAECIRNAGFCDLKIMRGGENFAPVFEGVDGHSRLIGEKINAFEAFAIEAVKPC